MPALGGDNTLRAYDDYQFHDLNSVVASAEVRVAMMAHIDAAAFYDAGNVAARYDNLNFSKRSIGVGLRIHTAHATFGRLDAAHGSEGWKFVLRTNDPFKLSRIMRKIAAAPFSP
jgi:hemolysin activation/secretion protein